MYMLAKDGNTKRHVIEQCDVSKSRNRTLQNIVLESFISFPGTLRARRRKKVLLGTTSDVIIRSQAQL